MRTLLNLIVLLSISALLNAQEKTTERPRFRSPDKKWEFRVAGENAVLVNTESGETIVDLSADIEYLAAETGKLIWAPDSRRFAFNARKGGKYFGCDLYELAGTTWKKLPELEENKALEQMIEQSWRKKKSVWARRRRR